MVFRSSLDGVRLDPAGRMGSSSMLIAPSGCAVIILVLRALEAEATTLAEAPPKGVRPQCRDPD